MSKKKLSFSFHSLFLSQFPLALYNFFFSFTYSHSRYSSRLHCPQSHSLELLPFSLLHQMAEWPYFILSSFIPSTSHKLNIASSFIWLDFCTSFHKCCWTFIHNYKGKNESNLNYVRDTTFGIILCHNLSHGKL